MVTVGGELSELESALATRFRADSARMLAEVADAIIARFPRLADDTVVPTGFLHTTLASHAATFAQLLERSPAVAPPEVSELGRTLAAIREPITTLTRVFEIGHETFWQLLVTMISESEDLRGSEVELLRLLTVRLFDYMQVNTSAALRAYIQRDGEETKATQRRRLAVVRGSLRGEVADQELEGVLGYRLLSQHVAYAARGTALEADELNTVIEQLRRGVRPIQHVTLYDDDVLYGWFTPRDATWHDRLAELSVPTAVTVACGPARHGPEGFRQSHRDALEVLRVADALDASGVRHYEESAVLALATHDPSAAKAFVDHQLGPLAEPSEQTQHLLRTLQVYLAENGSPTRAGRRLHTHRNTVIQRMERVEALLGRRLDPSSLALRVAAELSTITASRCSAPRADTASEPRSARC
ncbi:PucR family transcriptional regulator [Prauserella endophytica]|nr:helix-turn-helix domain-containing protein [Prauserella endophytica]